MEVALTVTTSKSWKAAPFAGNPQGRRGQKLNFLVKYHGVHNYLYLSGVPLPFKTRHLAENFAPGLLPLNSPYMFHPLFFNKMARRNTVYEPNSYLRKNHVVFDIFVLEHWVQVIKVPGSQDGSSPCMYVGGY